MLGLSALMGNKIRIAVCVVVVVFVNITSADHNVPTVADVLYVIIINRSHIALIVMALRYAKRTDHRIIQDVEQEDTQNGIGFVLIALRIYSQMLLGH